MAAAATAPGCKPGISHRRFESFPAHAGGDLRLCPGFESTGPGQGQALSSGHFRWPSEGRLLRSTRSESTGARRLAASAREAGSIPVASTRQLRSGIQLQLLVNRSMAERQRRTPAKRVTGVRFPVLRHRRERRGSKTAGYPHARGTKSGGHAYIRATGGSHKVEGGWLSCTSGSPLTQLPVLHPVWYSYTCCCCNR